MNIDVLIANRARGLRKAQGYSLDRFAELSGVSRSMISLIERGETSPTGAVLNRLANALGVTLASLFSQDAVQEPSPLARLATQPVWQDPATGYVRRHVSPAGYASPIELVEVLFPPGKTATFQTIIRSVVTHQQVWMLEGEMIITMDDSISHLHAGDCLAMTLGQRVTFQNPTRDQSRYAVVLTTLSSHSRRQG